MYANWHVKALQWRSDGRGEFADKIDFDDAISEFAARKREKFFCKL